MPNNVTNPLHRVAPIHSLSRDNWLAVLQFTSINDTFSLGAAMAHVPAWADAAVTLRRPLVTSALRKLAASCLADDRASMCLYNTFASARLLKPSFVKLAAIDKNECKATIDALMAKVRAAMDPGSVELTPAVEEILNISIAMIFELGAIHQDKEAQNIFAEFIRFVNSSATPTSNQKIVRDLVIQCLVEFSETLSKEQKVEWMQSLTALIDAHPLLLRDDDFTKYLVLFFMKDSSLMTPPMALKMLRLIQQIENSCLRSEMLRMNYLKCLTQLAVIAGDVLASEELVEAENGLLVPKSYDRFIACHGLCESDRERSWVAKKFGKFLAQLSPRCSDGFVTAVADTYRMAYTTWPRQKQAARDFLIEAILSKRQLMMPKMRQLLAHFFNDFKDKEVAELKNILREYVTLADLVML